MNELEKLREEIDSLDCKIVMCFEERTDKVLRVAEYKIKSGLQVLDSLREQALLKSRVDMLKNKIYSNDIEKLFKLLMKLSREKQQQLLDKAGEKQKELAVNSGIAAFQGELGANSHAALMQYFGKNMKIKNYAEFEDVFFAVQSGEVEFGVLPIENSSTGGININYDLFRKYDVCIIGEQMLSIDHLLLGIKDASIEDIKEVYSHEQAIMQCSLFLKEIGVDLYSYYNTAVSAKYIASQQDKTKAAIASGCAGKLYGLKVLAEDISNSEGNTTRFIIIAANRFKNCDANKASISFVLEHKSGVLAHALNIFAECGLNMVKIESRPLPEHNFEYIFYVDFQGDNIYEKIEHVSKMQGKLFSDFKLLGCYKSNG